MSFWFGMGMALLPQAYFVVRTVLNQSRERSAERKPARSEADEYEERLLEEAHRLFYRQAPDGSLLFHLGRYRRNVNALYKREAEWPLRHIFAASPDELPVEEERAQIRRVTQQLVLLALERPDIFVLHASRAILAARAFVIAHYLGLDTNPAASLASNAASIQKSENVPERKSSSSSLVDESERKRDDSSSKSSQQSSSQPPLRTNCVMIATEYFRRCFELDPTNVTPISDYASLLYELRRFEEGIDLLIQCITKMTQQHSNNSNNTDNTSNSVIEAVSKNIHVLSSNNSSSTSSSSSSSSSSSVHTITSSSDSSSAHIDVYLLLAVLHRCVGQRAAACQALRSFLGKADEYQRKQSDSKSQPDAAQASSSSSSSTSDPDPFLIRVTFAKHFLERLEQESSEEKPPVEEQTTTESSASKLIESLYRDVARTIFVR